MPVRTRAKASSPDVKLAPLPTEVQREIMRLAGVIEPGCMPKMMLASKKVRDWVEPWIYRVLRIDSVSPESLLFQELLDGKKRNKTTTAERSWTPFRVHTLQIAFIGQIRPDLVEKVLSICVAATDTAFFDLPFSLNPTITPLLESRPLRRLTVQFKDLFPSDQSLRVDFTQPLFASITHMNMLDAFATGYQNCERIGRMPALTHIAFREQAGSNNFCRILLADCPLLQMLVIISSEESLSMYYKDARAPFTEDKRLVQLVLKDPADDWVRGTLGEDDVWTRAAAIIRQR
ncbi:unnamed protein product [Mycena citricolor]|uniref:Uncharacterized protein n=1 Tax=Mycena citricolor TaxID=2018698 RepID=A0AAD2HAW5_9AGAR|nr:unnamed protein product [Mycena citricolor]